MEQRFYERVLFCISFMPMRTHMHMQKAGKKKTSASKYFKKLALQIFYEEGNPLKMF